VLVVSPPLAAIIAVMKREQLVQFIREQRLGVEASLASSGAPEAAVVAIAVSDRLELVFDTVKSSRKYQNLVRDPRIALVVGWDREITAQIEGVADFPEGEELERIREVYFARHPDGRDRLTWPGIVHVRVRPTWIRYSDFNQTPRYIVELDASEFVF
jgi:pyridoxine/pyridoxamine 5'-phosphate oxidase